MTQKRFVRRFLVAFVAAISLPCCALPLIRQSEVANLVADRDYARAQSALNDNLNAYGKNNRLLYLLDKGIVSHLSQDTSESIEAFAQAKAEYDKLYTKSLSASAATWLVNDHSAPYRGEDFERVMVNIFQALNYALEGDINEALVEVRDANNTLNLINNQYNPDKKNVYREDAFARLLSGILYEANGTREDINDAAIAYTKSLAIYEDDYAKNYGVAAPTLLKENILAAAQFMGPEEFTKVRSRFNEVKFLTIEEKTKKAEIIVIQYSGLSALKIQETIPLWLPQGYAATITFPVYETRPALLRRSCVAAADSSSKNIEVTTEPVEDISKIAVKNLANRKIRIFLKAAGSTAGKYVLERATGEAIGKKAGRRAENAFMILSSAYNLFSNRADVRSWQTLPSEIRIARLFLDEGTYGLTLSTFDAENRLLEKITLGKIKAMPGQKKFLIASTTR